MNTLEILAVILAVLVLFKIAFIMIAGTRGWIHFVAPLYRNKMVAMFIAVAGAVFTGYHVFQKFSAVEVGAVVSFVAFLAWMSFLPFGKKLIEMMEKIEMRPRDFWLSIIIWVVFAAWILCSVL